MWGPPPGEEECGEDSNRSGRGAGRKNGRAGGGQQATAHRGNGTPREQEKRAGGALGRAPGRRGGVTQQQHGKRSRRKRVRSRSGGHQAGRPRGLPAGHIQAGSSRKGWRSAPEQESRPRLMPFFRRSSLTARSQPAGREGGAAPAHASRQTRAAGRGETGGGGREGGREQGTRR